MADLNDFLGEARKQAAQQAAREATRVLREQVAREESAAIARDYLRQAIADNYAPVLLIAAHTELWTIPRKLRVERGYRANSERVTLLDRVIGRAWYVPHWPGSEDSESIADNYMITERAEIARASPGQTADQLTLRAVPEHLQDSRFRVVEGTTAGVWGGENPARPLVPLGLSERFDARHFAKSVAHEIVRRERENQRSQ